MYYTLFRLRHLEMHTTNAFYFRFLAHLVETEAKNRATALQPTTVLL